MAKAHNEGHDGNEAVRRGNGADSHRRRRTAVEAAVSEGRRSGSVRQSSTDASATTSTNSACKRFNHSDVKRVTSRSVIGSSVALTSAEDCLGESRIGNKTDSNMNADGAEYDAAGGLDTDSDGCTGTCGGDCSPVCTEGRIRGDF